MSFSFSFGFRFFSVCFLHSTHFLPLSFAAFSAFFTPCCCLTLLSLQTFLSIPFFSSHKEKKKKIPSISNNEFKKKNSYDSPFHLAEECSNANIASPRAIFLTSAVGGLFGWFLQLVVAYTVVSIPDALSSPLGQPFAAYLVQVLPHRAVLAVLSLTIIAGFFMGQGCMIAASRVTFAYARDDCFPFSNVWKRVNQRTKTPVNAVWFNTTVGCILLLLIFGGALAAGAMFSIGAIAAFVAFTTPIFIRVFFVGNRFRPGPWNLGRASIPIGVVASAFVALMVPVLCLPSVVGKDLDAASMNWTCLVYGGPMLGILAWWAVSARKWFKGPKVNVRHLMHGQVGEGDVLVGQDVGAEAGVDVVEGKAAEAAKEIREG